MNQTMWESLLRRVAALGCAALVIAALVAISIVRADQRNDNLAVATQSGGGDQVGNDIGGSTDASADVGAGDQATSSDAGALAGGSGAAASGSGTAARSTGAAATGSATPAAANPTGLKPHKGTDCPDYNPNVGVYCDHYTVGGTTVLSGPLAVYGEQGLKAAQAWLTYFNTVYAPSHGVRTATLKWYDDNLDPNQTLRYVQRMNEVDHVLYIGGVTSPEAISKYVMDAPCLGRAGKGTIDCPIGGNKGLPFIGDIGLSPKSYTTPLIYATAPSPEVRAHIDTRTAKDLYAAKKMGVIYDVLPGVDTSTVRAAWRDAEKQYGVEIGDRYVEITSTASSCSSEFSKATSGNPDFVWMPIAAGPMLACIGAAQTAGVSPGSQSSPWLKGWHGGSGLQVEVDNCRPTCEGMITGNIFRDPRSWPSPEMALYRQNVAKYAPSIDYTGFIAVNYYANGPVLTHLIEANNLQWNLTRKNLIDAANKFGPYDTGFGNTITWRSTLPRVPTECGYIMKVKGNTWSYQDNKICL